MHNKLKVCLPATRKCFNLLKVKDAQVHLTTSGNYNSFYVGFCPGSTSMKTGKICTTYTRQLFGLEGLLRSFGEQLQDVGRANGIDLIWPGPIHPASTAGGTRWVGGWVGRVSMESGLGSAQARSVQPGG